MHRNEMTRPHSAWRLGAGGAERPPVREVSVGSEIVVYAKPDEVAEVQRQIQALLAPFKERIVPGRRCGTG